MHYKADMKHEIYPDLLFGIYYKKVNFFNELLFVSYCCDTIQSDNQ